MTSDADALRKARWLIETKGWTQGEYAVDEHGSSCNPLSDEACAFCIEGALHAATHTSWNIKTESIPGYKLLSELAGNNLARWNDDEACSPSVVIALLDRAIALAESSHV